MSVIRFPPVLDPAAWDSAFTGPVDLFGPGRAGGNRDRLHLDFSRVEWIDLAVLAHTLLLLDGAVRTGAAATVTLPSSELTRADLATVEREAERAEERAGQRQIRHRASRRGQALAFMRQAGFERALETAGWPDDAVRIESGGGDKHSDGSRSDADGSADPTSRDGNRYRRLLPLRWLRRSQDAALYAVETGLRDLGVAPSDARAITQTVLAELIGNVAERAGAGLEPAPNVLVGAMLMDPNVFRMRRGHLLAPDAANGRSDAARATEGRVLRAVVGDCAWASYVGDPRSPRLSAQAPAAANTLEVAAQALAQAGRPVDVRGLQRVAQAVRSYRGCVTARTGDTLLSLAFNEDAEDGIEFTHRKLTWLPSTLYEALIVTDTRPADARIPWQAHPAARQDLALQWIDAALDADHGLDPVSREAYEAALAGIRSTGPDAGIVITLPTARRPTVYAGVGPRALRRALDVLGRAAEGAAVAAVFPDTDRRVLAVHAASLHSRADELAASRTGRAHLHPVLVFGTQGMPLWLGGGAPLRAVLEGLIESDGVMPLAQARRLWSAGHGELGAFDSAMQSLQHLLAIESGSLLLRLSPLTTLSSLKTTAQRVLSERVSHGGDGVVRGLFRTPSLAIAERWIDVRRLLEGSLGVGLAAFALARAAESALGGPRAQRLSAVAQAADCPPILTAALSECLGLGDSYFVMGAELDQDDGFASADLPEDADVVLCSTVIMTENAVRRAAAAIARHAATSVIACIVDGRGTDGPVTVLNREIPVVALARIDLRPKNSPPPGAAITDIDPILRCPAPPRAAERPTPLDEDELLALCTPTPGEQPGDLRLGHVRSARRMHFTASIYYDRLLQNDRARKRLVAVMAGEVLGALAELDRTHGPLEGAGPLALWFPGASEDFPAKLAHALQEHVKAAGTPVAAPMAVDRFVAGSVWQIMPPAADAEQPPRRVAIIDVGAVTGATVAQMVRKAAERGAARIVAVVLNNQLREPDPGVLDMIRAVRGGPDGAVDVPAAVSFVTRSSIEGFEASHCPVCATRAKYTDVGNAPARLRTHAMTLSDILAPRRREEVFATVPADLFNSPIHPAGAVDVLHWRRLLESALRDTSARKEVSDRLALLTEYGELPRLTRAGLIRLLAAEQHWLKLPPLRFTDCRRLVARICRAELTEPAPDLPWLRVQALIVLAVAEPEDFVRWLPELLALVVDEKAAVDQLLLDCYRLVRRPSHDTPVRPEQIRASLLRARDYLEESQSGWDHDLIEEFFQVVVQLIVLVDQPHDAVGGSAQSAWARLREEWCRPVERHHIERRLLRVRDFVEDLQLADLGMKLARAAEDNWESCARLVAERALGYLPQLRTILSGNYVGELLGPRDQKRLVDLSRTHSSELLTMTELVHLLTRQQRRPQDGDWQAQRREVLDRLSWWHLVLFAAHRPNSESPALLVDLLESAPCSPAEVLGSATAALGASIGPVLSSELEEPVFCPQPLLYEVFEQVFKNAWQHRSDGMAEPRFGLSASRPDGNTVRIAIKNTGSSPRPIAGRGLRELDRELRPFGCALRAEPLDGAAAGGDGWTFEAVITLQRWVEA